MVEKREVMEAPWVTPHGLLESRQAMGLSQDRLGSLLGVTRRSVRNWEKGVYPVPRWLSYALMGLKASTYDVRRGD